ncbi:transcription initiation factor TFIID subunit 9B-like isoform X1 [Mytilus galloprovincialis]|uniref:Transcription initiation factor TFIID subunit 9 n=2 Tax=Mytilus TaxID=6548 RepID=A0A8B6HK47_MYTGA|nr:transcription initiation factor TFIID subunit 9 [Mytilus galloprovincialis]
MAAPAKSLPRDAQIMTAILKDLGVTEHEPRVINQMLEFVYRYVSDILDDARVYSSHANKKTVDADDVKLAIQCRMDHSFTSPPPRDLLMDIAKHKNSQALPLIKPYSGLRLPPDRYCLSAPNYKMASHKMVKKQQARIQFGLPMGQQFPGSQRISITPHGIGKSSGNPNLSVVTKNMSVPTVTIVTKPQASTVVQRPAFRISAGTNLQPIHASQPMSSALHPSALLSKTLQISQSTASLISNNTLKRKHDDDDYDT